jgi:S1-C subfamily serine protease
MYSLGITYQYGDRVEVDIKEAIGWYEAAANRGHGNSQYSLAEIFSEEESEWSNYSEAMRWYQRAADNGIPDALAGLGNMHADGLGVANDAQTAARMYYDAALLGSTRGQALYGLSLLTGQGVTVNRREGFAWMLLGRSELNDDDELRQYDEIIEQFDPSPAEERYARDLAESFRRGVGLEAHFKTDHSDDLIRDELIESTQQALTALGYYDGEVDGLMGPQTAEAINSFQKAWDLPQTGRVSGELSIYIGAAVAMEITEEGPYTGLSQMSSSGSGFYISSIGHIVTNHHVVSGCEAISLSSGEILRVLASEEATDLALLQLSQPQKSSPLALRSGRGARLADEILVAGFPLSGIVTPNLNVTIGNITALSGPSRDRRLIQISAPIQPGNSGGPVLDFSGRVVGVVVSKLDALAVASETGDIPQNVNFGVSLGTLQSFLDANGVDYITASEPRSLQPSDVAEMARISTVKILCQ